MPIIPNTFLDVNGKPLAGGCLSTLVSGTATPLATYSDAAGTVPNANPVQLTSAGTAIIFLQGQAYTLKLYAHGVTNNCATSLGPLQYSIDGINPGANSILAANNVWTGSNTFNGPVTTTSTTIFNAGFSSNGPSIMAAGGSMAGTFSGNPIFSGTPHYSGMPIFDDGFSVNGTATFNGQIASTLATGTAPFIISSQTEVPNLNANFLEGGTWETPLAIGSTTPMNGTFTGLHATGNFQIASSVLVGGIQGADSNLLSSGTVASGAGHSFCTNAGGGATTNGCPASGFTQIATASNTGCSTQGTSFSNCDVTLTWSSAFADTSYVPTCSVKDTALQASGGDGSTGDVPNAPIRSFSTTQIVVALTTLAGRAITGGSTATIYCIGVHP